MFAKFFQRDFFRLTGRFFKIGKSVKKFSGQNPAFGFTLIEILVVIGMIAILAAVVLVAINPTRQFAQSRNSQRSANVGAILSAVGQNMADNKGLFTCPAGILPQTAMIMQKTGGYDIRPCIVPTYMAELPFDPSSGNNTCSSPNCSGNGESYDTQYTIAQDPISQRITVCAPGGAEPAISGSKAICVTR